MAGKTRRRKQPPKLPSAQLSILAVARFAEPIAYTSVFPYLPDMVRSFGVKQNHVARWTGMMSTVFSLAQSITAVPWGKASDRYGRKPILIWGLISTMVTFIIWGCSTSLTMAVVVRAISGGGNGNVGIIRTMVAEMVPEKELQPLAFSIMPLVWSLGSVIGPSFGGFFAEPHRQFPNTFGRIALLRHFPYLLPNLIAGVFFLISLASAVLFLRETLSTKDADRDWGLLVGKRLTRAFRRRPELVHRRSNSFVDGEATAPLVPNKVATKAKNAATSSSPPGDKAPGMKDVFTRQTVIALITYSFLAFHSIAYDQNINVFMSYPVAKHRDSHNTKLPFYFNGGFGLEPGRIGTIFAIYGIVCCAIQFLLYPPLVARFGILRLLKFCSILFPITYLVTPYTVLMDTAQGRFAALMVVMTFKAFCVIISFPSNVILLTNSASSLRILGTINGFATTFSGIGRGLGPITTGIVFDWGGEHNYIISAYYFLALVAAIGAIPVFMIVEGDGPSASAYNSDDDDDDDDDDEDSDSDDMGDSGVIMPDESAIDDSQDENEERARETQPLLSGSNRRGAKYSDNIDSKN